MQQTEAKTIWSFPPECLDLQPAQVDVWRIALDLPAATVSAMEATLSEDEQNRAARFRFPRGRECYIAAHASLRDILARYLDCEPSQLHFLKNEFGKPALLSRALEFNLSHSGDFALVAVTRGQKVGVDVEHIRPDLDRDRIARRFFSPSETAELMAFSPHQRDLAFFACWTRKEAYIKAQGLGLSLPLDSFDVSLGEPAILRATRPDAEEAARWRLLSLHVEPGYVAAVAAEGAALSLSKGAALSLSKGRSFEFRLWNWADRC